MQSIRSLLGVAPPKSAPVTIETDEVYPVHAWDDNKTLRGIIVTWTMMFDEVLDADVLRKGLEGVLAREGWRKLGGRIRRSVRLFVYLPRF
jgi:hypothetical protein